MATTTNILTALSSYDIGGASSEDWYDKEITRIGSPEVNLMFAVLEDAVHILQYWSVKSEEWAEAYEWVMSRENQDDLFSVSNIATQFELDVEALREGVQDIVDRRKRKRK